MAIAHDEQATDTSSESAAGPERVVVVGVDGSEGSSAALRWAAEEARLRGATLRVVHAWFVPSLGYGTIGHLPASAFEDMAGQARVALRSQVTEVLGAQPSVRLDERVVEGPAAR